MTNINQNKLSIVKDDNSNAISEQRFNFLEKILNDKSYNHKELEGFRTKILQDRSNQKECGISWSKSFVR